MKSEPYIKLYPLDPFTDTKLTVVIENGDRDSSLINIEGWRRILPNKTAVNVDNREGINYQCTPLDQNCCI